MSDEFEVAPWGDIERKYREAFERGDPRALMEFVVLCVLHHQDPPVWAAREFIQRWADFKGGKFDTLGAAYSCPDHKKTDQRKMIVGAKVFNRLCYLIEGTGRPVDQNLFDEVGEEFGMSGSWVRERYYEILKDDDGIWSLGTGKP